MRKTTTRTALTLALSLGAPLASAAPLPTPAELRQAIQQDFIVAAVDEGRLSQDQGADLLEEQAGVLARIDEARADGLLAVEEVATLAFLLDRSSRSIDRALEAQRAAAAPALPERTAQR